MTKTLKELFEEAYTLESVFNINEIFDTKFAKTDWKLSSSSSDKNEIAEIEIDGSRYQIKIEHLTYTDKNKNVHEFVNATFARWNGFAFDESLTLTTGGASKILGAIMNALRDRINHQKYSAVVFAATDNVEKRMKIYNSMAWRLLKFFTNDYGLIENQEFDGGKMSILVRKDQDENAVEKIKGLIKK